MDFFYRSKSFLVLQIESYVKERQERVDELKLKMN